MKYFGTDGIRQKADKFTPDFLSAIVKGLVNYDGDNIKVLIGGDTRESTEWLLADLETVLETFGLEYGNVGILPTPAINYCFNKMGFSMAIDVTASHNPYQDNGIKIFELSENGPEKLSEKGREKVEEALEHPDAYTMISPSLREDLHAEAIDIYTEHLLDYIGDIDFSGLHIGMDCANGATSVIKDSVFTKLGAKVEVINSDAKYGTSINHECGSTHLESLQKLVKEQNLDFGVAFDGDGDRCLIVDENGEIVDGDQILAILMDYLGIQTLAFTVMANQGLLNWAKDNQFTYEVTPVGDSHVVAAMKESHLEIGGEQSGHIILPGEPMGDGMLTALMVACAYQKAQKPMSKLASIITKLPQIMVNLPAHNEEKQLLEEDPEIRKTLLHYAKLLEEISGRLLVRPSGTENLIRITMWGDDADKIHTYAHELKNNLEKALKS